MFSKVKLGLVAAAVAFFLMPSVSEAQRGRGWGGGGWGGGGYRGNNWGRPGIGIGIGTGYGNSGFGNRGYYGNNFYGNGYNNRGYYGNNFGGGLLGGAILGSSLYGGGLYNRGYSNQGYYSNGSYYSSPSVVYSSSTPYVQGEVIQSGAVYPQQGETFAGGTPTSFSTPANTASITVKVPANATVWWNGSQTSLSGDTRYFRTGSLGADGSTQTFRARWTDSTGQQVDLTREVRATANAENTIDFTRPDDNQNRPVNANPANPANPVNQ